jgi:hypothetical protein
MPVGRHRDTIRTRIDTMTQEMSNETYPLRRHKVRTSAVVLMLAVFVLSITTACGGSQSGEAGSAEVRLAPVSQLSAEVRAAPPVVQEAYRFAVANPEILDRIPCYCGCGSMGHMDNLDCFVQELDPDGSPTFDSHALG